jgi:translocation and assembly module TamB
VGFVLLALGALLIGGVMWYASTPQFENRVRQRVIAILEGATGGRVELGAFRWRLLRLEFEADNLTIHGLEPAGQVPYAHIDRLFVRVKIISFFRTKVGLNYLEADHPVIHLIVYPDGSTNQPHPKTESTSNKSVTDTLFDLQVNRTELNNGLAIVDQQATPFDLAANNLGIKLQYVAPPLGHPTQDLYQGSIHIEDLTAQRGVSSPVHSKLDLQVQLERNAATLQSFNLQTGPSTLAGRLALQNFADPQWKGSLNGSVDVRLVEAFVSIPGLDKGNVELQLTGQGTMNTFTVDGQSKVTGGAYHTGTIHLAGVNATTALHLNENELTLTNSQAKLAEGGTVDGTLRIVNWSGSAPPVPEKPQAAPGRRGPPQAQANNKQQGTIRAHISDMTVASIMSIVAPPRDANLGFATFANGAVNLDWKGDSSNFVMDAKLALTAPQQPRPGEVPLNGTVDAQYMNGSGTVNIRSFTAQTPGMQIQVNGALGVYPLTRASQVNVELTTSKLAEFDRTLKTLGLAAQGKTGVQAIPIALHGQAAFHGTVTRSILTPDVRGHLTATNFDVVYSTPQLAPLAQPASAQPIVQPANHNVGPAATATEHTIHWDSLEADAEYAPELISVHQASLVHGASTIHASGTLHAHQLTHHQLAFDEDSALSLDASIRSAALSDILQTVGQSLPVTGTVNLDLHASGQFDNLSGGGHLAVQGGDIYGEPYRSLNTDLRFAVREIVATHLVYLQDGGKVQGEGGYNLSTEMAHFTAQGTDFDLARFKTLQNTKYPISGLLAFEAHGNGTVKEPNLEAKLHLTHLNLAEASTGFIDVNVHTQSDQLLLDMNGHMTNAVFQGNGQVQLSGDYQAKGHVTVSNLDVEPLLQTFNVLGVRAHSSIAGAINVAGPLKQPRNLGGDATIDQFSLSLANVPLKTEGPLHATLMNGRLHLDPFHVVGDDTDLHAQGSIGLFAGSRDLDLHGRGSINMKLAQTLDSDITASGHVDFNVDAVGTFQRPSLTGQVKFTNVAMALQDFPNGLSQMTGTLQFDQDRLDVKSLTAVSGGGKLQLGGFVTYQQGLYGDLTATAKDVRIRYPQGVSSMADAKLRLQGTQSALLLSGNVTITRFVIGGDLDLAALTSSAGTVSLPPDPNAPSSHLRLDIHIVSAPQLDFQNSYAKLAGDVDLRLRGTLAQPSLLGHIAITEGSASFAGTKYELQRGDIYFSNPVRIEPLIDLTATAHVEDYDITIGLNGTSSKLQPTFRSEPPLSEQDIFALLAVGRTQEEQQIYSMQQQQAGVNSTADALLGGALNATVSSRIEKLFGGGSVKIDPNYVTGTGNSSARITVEQQVAKNATLTYATNINSTAEQFIQGQVNLTRDLSVIAVRDENGVFSLIFKIRRRYK